MTPSPSIQLLRSLFYYLRHLVSSKNLSTATNALGLLSNVPPAPLLLDPISALTLCLSTTSVFCWYPLDRNECSWEGEKSSQVQIYLYKGTTNNPPSRCTPANTQGEVETLLRFVGTWDGDESISRLHYELFAGCVSFYHLPLSRQLHYVYETWFKVYWNIRLRSALTTHSISFLLPTLLLHQQIARLHFGQFARCLLVSSSSGWWKVMGDYLTLIECTFSFVGLPTFSIHLFFFAHHLMDRLWRISSR